MGKFASIQTRILFPFLILFAVVFSLITYLTLHMISYAVEVQIKEQMVTLSRLLSRSGFPLDDIALQQVSHLLHAEVITLDNENRIQTSTLSAEMSAEANRFFQGFSLDRGKSLEHWEGYVHYVTFLEKQFLLSYSPVRRGSVRGLVLLFDAKRVKEMWWNVARHIVVIAVSATFLVIIISLFVAKSITKPIKQLADKTSEIAKGDLSSNIVLKARGEVQQLASSFNSMLEGLRRYQNQLVQKEKLAALGMFAATVAHEVKNPLSSIKMTCQVLKSSNTDSQIKEEIEIILEEVERLNIAVNSILFFTASPRKEVAEVNITSLLNEVVRLLSRQFEHRHISVKRDFASDIPNVYIDSNKLKTIVVNLLLNASEAIPQGGEIILSVELAEKFLKVSVADTGTGLSKEAKAHLFEPFFSTKAGGSGLGLAIVKKLVDEEGGEITCDTRNGRTVFTVCLPIHWKC